MATLTFNRPAAAERTVSDQDLSVDRQRLAARRALLHAKGIRPVKNNTSWAVHAKSPAEPERIKTRDLPRNGRTIGMHVPAFD